MPRRSTSHSPQRKQTVTANDRTSVLGPADRTGPDAPSVDSVDVSRRRFLAMSMAGTALLGWRPAWSALAPIEGISNPLEHYPSRRWESIYRDQYHYDRSFTWICAPNDTHMCRLRAFVRNGVMVRAEQNYDHDRCGDLYGNTATKSWNPRGCPKGYTFHRRVYGPYRLKGPVIRAGWKRWADDGFPSLSDEPTLRSKYKFDDRGNDTFVRVSWEEAARYTALGLKSAASTYSGPDGRRRLLADGYDPLMLTHWKGAGTRVIKMGSNLPLHGLIGKFGIYRLANMMALLDHHVRGVGPDEALGARDWNEYTWRGDQAPGTPFATGLQASDMDFNDLRFSKLIIQVGKNLVENKMPESHWLNETMERGAKIVCITPDYSAPSAKCDYWIGTRPGLGDLALVLGVTRGGSSDRPPGERSINSQWRLQIRDLPKFTKYYPASHLTVEIGRLVHQECCNSKMAHRSITIRSVCLSARSPMARLGDIPGGRRNEARDLQHSFWTGPRPANRSRAHRRVGA